MKTLRRIWSAVTAFVLGRYEAATQSWGEDSWLFKSYQDAHLDIDKFSREELQSRHRNWVANNGFILRLKELFVQFSVGVCGLEVVPNSDDEAWNESNKASFDAWSQAPDLGSHLSLCQLDKVWAGSLFEDGETFINCTEDSRLQPRVMTIEAHRVQTPPRLREEEGKTVIDGIRVDRNHKPLSYFVKIGPKADDFAEVPAFRLSATGEGGGMIHIFKMRRPGQMRGIPEGHSGMKDLHGLDDLHKLQMQKAKAAAIVTNIIWNASGEADPSQLRRTRMLISSTNAAGDSITKDKPVMYDSQLGAYTKYLRIGEQMQQFKQDEPGVVTQQYWDLVLSKICCAYNQPKLLVVPYTLQGTVTRADLDVCANAYRANFELIAWAKRKIYEWRTAWAVRFDRSLDGERPANFLAVIIRPPRAPNVDIGYTAQALETEMRTGVKPIQDVYAERQQDWRTQLRQIAETRAYIKQLAKEFDLHPDEISQVATIQAAEPEDEEEEEEEPATAAATA